MAGYYVAGKSLNELLWVATRGTAPNEVKLVRKFAKSGSLTANSEEDVWEYGGIRTITTTAETMSFASTSTEDNLAGTGAGILLVDGLDGDYNEISELVTLTGTTPVVSTNAFLIIHRIRVVFSGSTKANVGNITATATGSNGVQGYISATTGITQQSFYCVPAGWTAYTIDITYSIFRASGGSGDKAGEIEQMAYSPETNTSYRTLKYGIKSSGGSPVQLKPGIVASSPEKTTLWFDITPENAGGVAATSAGYLLIKNGSDFV